MRIVTMSSQSKESSMADGCNHGGKLFEIVGADFSKMEQIGDAVAADVLDAWYPPSPLALRALGKHLEWATHTAPPLNGDGVKEKIAEVRGIFPEEIVLGSGSSDLIFRLIPQFLANYDPVVIVQPCYGEYRHVLGNLCRMDVIPFSTEDNEFQIDVDELASHVIENQAKGLVLINPCNPTGRFLNKEEMLCLLGKLPVDVRVVVDETYIEYAGPGKSLEQYARKFDDLLIIKSMSKVYGLSGLRAGYAVANKNISKKLDQFTPPYVLSTLAQLAVVAALEDRDYTETMLLETHARREYFVNELNSIADIRVMPSIINCIILDLCDAGISAETLNSQLRRKGILGRDITDQGVEEVGRYLRLAVLDSHTSLIDTFLYHAILPPETCYIAKSELKSLPLLGKAFVMAGNIFVERNSGGSGLSKLLKEITMLPPDHWIFFHPEGTRNTGGLLGNFKRGFASAALKRKCPVVPIVSMNGDQLWPKGNIFPKPGLVRVKIGKTISTESWSESSLSNEVAYVRSYMQEMADSLYSRGISELVEHRFVLV